jgi:hypothetical protein
LRTRYESRSQIWNIRATENTKGEKMELYGFIVSVQLVIQHGQLTLNFQAISQAMKFKEAETLIIALMGKRGLGREGVVYGFIPDAPLDIPNSLL